MDKARNGEKHVLGVPILLDRAVDLTQRGVSKAAKRLALLGSSYLQGEAKVGRVSDRVLRNVRANRAFHERRSTKSSMLSK